VKSYNTPRGQNNPAGFPENNARSIRLLGKSFSSDNLPNSLVIEFKGKSTTRGETLDLKRFNTYGTTV
jgi:hypothetical protein